MRWYYQAIRRAIDEDYKKVQFVSGDSQNLFDGKYCCYWYL